MWYLGRTARKEKLNLELEFFHRIQRMLIKYDQEFEGYKFDDGIWATYLIIQIAFCLAFPS